MKTVQIAKGILVYGSYYSGPIETFTGRRWSVGAAFEIG